MQARPETAEKTATREYENDRSADQNAHSLPQTPPW